MKICHYIPTQFPTVAYGGTERVAYWLAKAQVELGHDVSIICKAGSRLPFGQIIEFEGTEVPSSETLQRLLPSDSDILQLYSSPSFEVAKLQIPYLVTIGGNAQPGERFHPNTVFVSENHAKRHHWTEFVHNGLDISEYPLGKDQRKARLLFLAKASWSVKNLRGAEAVARAAQLPLDVCGGSEPLFHRLLSSLNKSLISTHFWGMVGGEKKLKLLQETQALIFPVVWEEPFGLAVIEALACGTPVVATPRGALPEILNPSCGILANSFEELVAGVKKAKDLTREDCRNRVLEAFTHIKMAEKYLHFYKKIISDGKLREGFPFATHNQRPEALKPYLGYKKTLKDHLRDLR